MIPFGPWEPDKPARLNDGVMRVADGVFPLLDGYRPAGQWEQIIPALPDAPKGGASFTSRQGISSIIAGTATGLYRGLSTGFVLLASGFSTMGRWRFAQFGGLAIATNGSDPMQKISLSDYAVAPLAGDPPKFEHLAVVRDFLVGGIMNGDIMTLAWSGINNAESWSFGSNQSDLQIMPTGGRITGILSGEFGVILQKERICRMDYIGGNIVFEINEVSSNIGCVSVHTVAQWGRLGFFWSKQGPMMWDGAQPIPIGEEKVDRWIGDRYGKDDWGGISTAIDPAQNIVTWSLPATETEPGRLIGYNWAIERWFTLPFASSVIFAGVTRDISIDEQDPAIGSDDDDIDGEDLTSLDDPAFRGGDPRLYVFNASHALGAFTGSPMAATLTLGDMELFKGRRTQVRMARPETDAGSGLTLTLGTRARLPDALSNTTSTSLTASGDMPIRASGRFIRPSLAIAAGTAWGYAKGLEFMATPGAMR